jgi:putative heme-binding domain-containing protein
VRDILRCAVLLPLLAGAASAVELGGGGAKPDLGAQDEAAFLKSLTVSPGFTAAIWASGTQVLNAVAIDIDERGRVFAAETARWRWGGVIDVRGNMFLYKDDLRVTTGEERRAMIEKWKDKFPKDFFTKATERIRLIEDTDGDGRADRATVFAEGFNDAIDGPAAGIMVRDGTVWLACIPKIYALTERNGKASARTVLSEGYGPRFSISGHDLHGLAMGMDGRVYWSMGDRGYNLTTREGTHVAESRRGGVFRCDPDGSNVELYYLGLRNPQELAFDAQGNLFTVDNNADMGDAARVCYLMEGGTSGWDHGWQLLGNDSFTKNVGLEGRQPDPWMEEGMWKMPFPEQPAWILPPVGLVTSGPCGLAYCPGSTFNAKLADRFLVCDYRASADSGVWSFKLNASGAGFTLPVEQKEKFLWGLPPTDVVFGYDGRIYISDYIGGWELNDHGRILTMTDPALAGSTAVKELKTLVASGIPRLSLARLAPLLAHDDLRVRQRAQFELVERGSSGRAVLAEAARSGATPFARLHGIWGLGQLARRDASAAQLIMPLLDDRDSQVCEQAVKVLGDARYAPAAPALVALLQDPSPRVQAAAAIALGRLHHRPAIPGLVRILRDNADRDPYLRHAAVMGLVGTADAAALNGLAGDASPAVRMGVLLALRRSADPGIGAFLDDESPQVRAEAIRAVYDLPIPAAMPKLIAQLAKPLGGQFSDATRRMLHLRLVNAAYRYGDAGAAVKLVEFAAGSDAAPEVRAVALKALAKWDHASWIDPVVGYPRPALRREAGPDPAPLKDGIMRIVAREEEQLLGTAVRLAQDFGYGVSDATLLGILDNPGMSAEVRGEALGQLAARGKDAAAIRAEVLKRLPTLLHDGSGVVRSAAFDVLIANDRAAGLAAARAALADDGSADPDVRVVADRTDDAWTTLATRIPDEGLDLARAGAVTWVDLFAKPHPDAGAQGALLPRLNDGRLAATDDDTSACTWFDEPDARFVLDLKQSAEIGRVDTWSWHKANRAPQDYILWGSDAATMPDPASPNPSPGWTRIARASSLHLPEGGKHGTSIYNGNGALGRFRWLMWQCQRKGTFFTEIAVYAKGRTPSGLVRVAADRTLGGWDELSMHGPAAPGAALAGLVATAVPGFAKPAPEAGAQDGRLPRLFSAALPENDHDPAHATWFEPGEARFLVDLGQARDLLRVATYSWHQKEHAKQSFVLWGSAAATAPEAAAKELAKNGWTRIASVDTGAIGEGGRQGTSIQGSDAALGSYRWLLWQCPEGRSSTWFDRIDVFAADGPPPAPLTRTLGAANVALKQHVFAALGALDDQGSADFLGEWLDRLVAGTAPPQVELELTTAAAARSEPAVAGRLAKWRAQQRPDDPLAPYRVSLAGGDAEKGKELFRFHLAQCIKCHSVDKDGGNAGPDLMGVGSRLARHDILQSLIVPSAVVVPGFGVASVTRADGSTVSGALLKQDDHEVVVRTADGKEVPIPAAQVAKVTPPVSPMPPMGAMLSPTELRDVIAYLVSLK